MSSSGPSISQNGEPWATDLTPTAVGNSPSKSHRQRILSLLGSILVSLSAGSNYAFSTFGPQLQDSLHLTSTQLNIVGALGNMGVYLSGPLWGKWVDKRGPRLALLVGAIMILCSYGGMSVVYRYSSPSRSAVLPAFLNLVAGAGNSAAFTAAMNAQAKSFSGSQRGSATALVLAGFGLSAFMYSTLSHELFPGNTSDYLILLALGSCVSFLVGIVFVQIIPPAPDFASESAIDDHFHDEDADVERARRPSLRTRRRTSRTSQDLGAEAYIATSDDEEYATSEGEEAGREEEGQRLVNGDATKPGDADKAATIDITGWKLVKQTDFRVLFLISCLISGSGLLLINNVGTITRTLWEYNNSRHDAFQEAVPYLTASSSGEPHNRSRISAIFPQLPYVIGRTFEDRGLTLLNHQEARRIQQEQAHQVSAISIGNASGRVAIGLLSDLWVNYTGSARQRVWLLLPVTLLAFSAQFLFALPETIDNVHNLLYASALGGFAYGAYHGVAPCLTFEWFGLRHAARNWSLVALAPVVSGNIFNLLFGKVFDSHVPASSPTHQCTKGEECYRTAFLITSTGTACSVFVALVLILRRAGIPSLGGGASGRSG